MKIIKGDLIKLAEQGHFNFIVHGCNCFHTMGGGIAGQLANKYPLVLQADKTQTDYADSEKLGSWSVANLSTFTVINAYTQYYFSSGEDVFEYDHFQNFLKEFAKMFFDYDSLNNFQYLEGGQTKRIRPFERITVGFPTIGAGLAGGNWSRIKSMIEEFSEQVKEIADVTIVEFQK